MIELMPHQVAGADWMADTPSALLADCPGLGKSAQFITAARWAGAEQILMTCPASLKTNWAREFDKFWPGHPAVSVLSGTKTRVPNTPIVIVNYDIAHAPAVFHQLRRRQWDVLGCDEMHFLKAGPDTARGRAVIEPDNGLVRSASSIWGLSGTPMPNHPAEIFWWLLATCPQVLSAGNGMPRVDDYYRFLARYCRYRETRYGEQIMGGKNLEELKKRLAPILLRRRKHILGLPELRVGTVTVEAKQLGDLKRFEAHDDFARIQLLVDALDPEDDAAAEQLLEELKQVDITTLRRLTGVAKALPVAELVKNELESGVEKIVLFCWHREVIDTLAAALAQFGVVTVHGGTSQKARQQAVDKFQSTTGCRVFIGNIQAAGTGLTLTAASDLLMVESSWVPGENRQAIDRIHRIGQASACLARFVCLAGSIDEVVQRVQARKAAVLYELLS